MRHQTRTNPAYARMAYRKAILGHLVVLLRADFTTAMGGDQAERVIHSEDVFREDSEVPETEIQDYIDELQLEEENIRLELLKFDFVKRNDDKSKQEQPTAKKASSRRSKNAGAVVQGQGKR